jgi:uncharacterized membrane protein (UPF0182 family)
MNRLLEAMKDPYKGLQQEKRRALEINAEFYEKLSTLNAGSIAIAASIILAIEARSTVIQTVLHHIFIVVILLSASLLLGILHNLFAAIVAKVEAAYSETDFIGEFMKRSLSSAREATPIDDATAAQLRDMFQLGLHPKRNFLAKAM